MAAGVWLPVVVPGIVSAAVVAVAPVPTMTACAPAMLSVKTVPAALAPAVPVNDQRLTSAALTEGSGSPASTASVNANRISVMLLKK